MIDAGPSLLAAEGLPASALTIYLRSTGWDVRPSRVDGIVILSKMLPAADGPVEFVLPVAPGFGDEKRRVADALRSIQVIEERSFGEILSDVWQAVERENAKRTLTS
jgi:hypothetical protein